MSEIIKTILKASEIKNNPNNPRLIKDDKFKKLVKSIKDFPEMLDTREIVVNKDYVILGGNMRFKAAQEAGIKDIPVKIVDWSEDRQREFIIKDNVSGGEWDWDMLANEWEDLPLDEWGMDLPTDWASDDEPKTTETDNVETEMNSIVVIAFDNVADLDKITELYNLEAIDIPTNVKEDIARARKAYVFKA